MAGEPDRAIMLDDISQKDADNDRNLYIPTRCNFYKMGGISPPKHTDTDRQWRVIDWEDFARLLIGRFQAPHFTHNHPVRCDRYT